MRKLARVLGGVWSLARPYFSSEDRLFAWSMVFALLMLSMGTVGLSVIISYSQAIFFTALQRKDPDGFLRGLFWFTPRPGGLPWPPFTALAVINIGLNAVSMYLQGWLQVRWQKSLTARLLRDWLDGRTGYVMSLIENADSRLADNPDQRIQEDVEDFTRNSISFTFGLLTSISTVVSYSAVLWTLSVAFHVAGFKIPGYLLWAAMLYAAVATWLTHRAGGRLAQINFIQQRLRGDFRHGLSGVRGHMEEIALLGGQTAERLMLSRRFDAYAANVLRMVGRTAAVTFLSLGFDQVAIIFPTAIAAPSFFSGAITFGTLNQIRLGFLQMSEAMLWFVSTYASLAAYVSQVERLRTFEQALARARNVSTRISFVITDTGPALSAALRVETPAGRALLSAEHLVLAPGTATAIVAPSGSGKSSFLRAIAGLWPFGDGEIEWRSGEHFFLPQRPYVPDGAFRAALCYPSGSHMNNDDALREVLSAVGLAQFADLLDVSAGWSQRLSLGEQQRLSIARVLLRRPVGLFMDEPTSSLEDGAQIALFRAIRSFLPECALLTVTHSASIAQLHDVVMRKEGTELLGDAVSGQTPGFAAQGDGLRSGSRINSHRESPQL